MTKTFLEVFEKAFTNLHLRSATLIDTIPADILFRQPLDAEKAVFPYNSCGECILRSAGVVEQTFGGITRRLWDDPFEWTLPEYLSTREKVLEYLFEVEQSRIEGFKFFSSDEDLRREMPAPVKLKTLHEILLETLIRAEHLQGRAYGIFRAFSNEKLPRV